MARKSRRGWWCWRTASIPAFVIRSVSSAASSAHAIRSRWVSMSSRSAARAFAFPALTYWPKRSSSRMAYLSLFPIGAAMRANLMVYREIPDPWLSTFRQTPEQTMLAMMPGLRDMMGEFRISSPVKIRPADLCISENHLQPGVVLAGDAFSTSCPAAGHRDHQGPHRRRAAVQLLYSAVACDGRHGRPKNGRVLQRSGEDGVRRAMPCQGLRSSFAVD